MQNPAGQSGVAQPNEVLTPPTSGSPTMSIEPQNTGVALVSFARTLISTVEPAHTLTESSFAIGAWARAGTESRRTAARRERWRASFDMADSFCTARGAGEGRAAGPGGAARRSKSLRAPRARRSVCAWPRAGSGARASAPLRNQQVDRQPEERAADGLVDDLREGVVARERVPVPEGDVGLEQAEERQEDAERDPRDRSREAA